MLRKLGFGLLGVASFRGYMLICSLPIPDTVFAPLLLFSAFLPLHIDVCIGCGAVLRHRDREANGQRQGRENFVITTVIYSSRAHLNRRPFAYMISSL